MNDFYEDFFKEMLDKGFAQRDYDEFFDETAEIYTSSSNLDSLLIPKEHVPHNIRVISFGSDNTIKFSSDEIPASGLIGITQHSKNTEDKYNPRKMTPFATHKKWMDLHIERYLQHKSKDKKTDPKNIVGNMKLSSRILGMDIYTLDHLRGERVFIYNSSRLPQ